MEGPTSNAIDQAVVIVIIGAILAVVWTVFAIVNDNTEQAKYTLDGTLQSAYASEIESLKAYDKPLPATSVFLALEKNAGYVESVSGVVDGVNINSINDLAQIFHKKIYVDITEPEVERYVVVVRE